MLDGLPDPVLTLDERAVVVFANDAARMLLDGDNRVVTGRALSSLLRQPGLLAAIGAVIDGEPARQIEITLAGQVERFVEAWVEPLSGAHGARVLVVMRDMTVVRRGEGVRAGFVANVSHELRTPLASLLGFIETLRGPAADDRAAQGRFLAMMDEQAARMARLVDDLLSLSRIEMNEHQLPATEVALPTLLQSLVDQLAPQAAQAQVTVTIDAAPTLPAVQGDGDDLARLFQNLIENAIKYGRKSSTVTVTVGAGENVVTVTVADQGEGIAPEHLPRLTERFYRVDAARSRALGGTGLGLAIVKHIVNRHQGRLKIESEVGVGSRFIVVLPVATPSEDGSATVTELQ
ncbi:MAG: phosphate regulon sensor histidine kinase PhoR [Alphaproteobacteria bacterium]